MSDTQATQMSAETFWNRLPESVQYRWSFGIAASRPSKTSPLDEPLSLKEKEIAMECMIRSSDSTPEEKLKFYEENAKKYAHLFDPNANGFGPPRGVTCSSKTFGDIQLFYHEDEQPMFGTGSYSFYIARPGASPNQCIDWRKEGIKITALGFGGDWGECLWLKVSSGSQIRVHYGDGKTQDVVFPNKAGKEGNPWSMVFTPPRDVSRDVLQM